MQEELHARLEQRGRDAGHQPQCGEDSVVKTQSMRCLARLRELLSEDLLACPAAMNATGCAGQEWSGALVRCTRM